MNISYGIGIFRKKKWKSEFSRLKIVKMVCLLKVLELDLFLEEFVGDLKL